MESLPMNGIFKFPPNTLHNIREIYNLDKPGQMDDAIDLLDAWVKKQNHFVKKDFCRDYLERTIISSKGSIERAKSRIDKNCTLRTILSKFYVNYNSRKELSNIISPFILALLPQYAEDYYRVIVWQTPKKTNEKILLNFFRYIVILWEYMKKYDYVNGVILVCDMTDVDIVEFVKNLNITDWNQAATLILEGIGLRLKGLHIITTSKTIDLLVTILKQVMAAKLRNRVIIHQTIESLPDTLPKNILPKDFGGNEKSLQELQDAWLDVLSSEDYIAYMKELKHVTTNESLRRTDVFNEQFLGMAGTFRTLNVD